MQLKVIIEENLYTLEVPDELVRNSEDFFSHLDQQMDQGVQMGRQWVSHPSGEDRLRFIGDRLLGALEQERHDVGRMMAAYLLNRAPRLDTLILDSTGEIQNTEITYTPS